MELSIALATMAFLILVCLLSSKLSSWINMPTLIMFLGVGMLAGSEGIGGLAFENAVTANYIGSFAMAFILFSGGFDTGWKSVKQVLGCGGLLASVGVLLTAIFVGVMTWGLLNWLMPEKEISLSWCLLLGSIVSSTDAAAVFSILRSKSVSLKGKLQPLLEFESGSNDPMAAFLTIFMVGVITTENASGYLMPWTGYWVILPTFAAKMSLGIFWGYGIGRLVVWAYNKFDFNYDGLYYVLAFMVVIFTFSTTELLYGNGFMAVYVAGLTMGNRRFLFHNSIGKYYDGTAWLMQVILFTMLGLLAFPHQLWEAKWIGLGAACILMLIARPAAVFLCMIRSKFSFPERLLVSWVGLRGGAPIMLATFPLMAKIENDQLIFHIVFFIVLMSVVLQGMTLMPVARLLKLEAPLKKTVRNPLIVDETGNSNAQSLEFVIPDAHSGRTLADLKLPGGALVLLIRRDDSLIVPRGDTQLKKDDYLTIMGSDKALEQCALMLSQS